MSDEFDIGAAVDAIGEGLGFETSAEEAHTEEVETTEVPAVDSVAAETTDETPETTDSAETTEETPAESGPLTAPKTWRKEALAEWDKTPPLVQQEILKREEDMFRGIESYKTQAQIGQNFSQVIQPFEQYFQQMGVNPYEEIHGLLGMAHTAQFGTPEQKLELVLAISSQCGVDLLDAAEAHSTRPAVDPQVQTLQAELNRLKSAQQNDVQARQAQVRAELDAQLTAFAADPKHPYFDEVMEEMAVFYNSGTSKTLDDAYERAVWANPVTRSKEQARQAAEAKAQNEAKIRQAKQASAANLSTNRRQASATAPVGTMDQTLEATLQEIRSRG